MSISPVSNAPATQVSPPKAAPAPTPPAADSDKGAATTQSATPSAADAAKAQTAANAKVNSDGTVGPHHKKRVLHPGQAGYKPPAAPPAAASTSTQTPGTGQTLNVKA